VTGTGPRIERVATAAYTFGTPDPEADGTLSWSSVTMVTVTLEAGGETGLGWTYSSPAAAEVVTRHLAAQVHDADSCAVVDGWTAMRRACRNLGTKGLVMQAISAVDIAWWDLKARLLATSLPALLGTTRDSVPIYGSGGFTTLDDRALERQVQWWHSVGCTAMKIKIGESWGTRPERDLARVQRLRDLAGPRVDVMVDANGGYSVGQARRVGAALDDLGVTWFEEPVSSEDTEGLRTLRSVLACDIAAGEYAADLQDATALLGSVDCLQLDATRCGGYTGWLRCAALAQAHHLDVSAHCAPALHAPVAAAVPRLRHLEWFADHVRIEREFLTGVPDARGGALILDERVRGHGMALAPQIAAHRVA
jgi:L-alanine-DL-glutamate epimerase-like enolase superfamily enzyme